MRPVGKPFARDALRPREPPQGAVVVDRERRRGDALAEAAEERRGRRVEARRVERGQDEVVEEIRHGLRPEDDPVAARRHPLAAEGPDRPVRGLDARLLGELVQTGARGPAGALGVHRLDHAGRGGGDEGRLVRLDLGKMRGHDGDPLLHDGDVAAQEEPEAAQTLLALGELGEARGGRERPQGAGDDPPAGGDQIARRRDRAARVVVGGAASAVSGPGPGQRDERRVVHRTLPRLGEGAPHAFAGEVGGLRPEAEARPGRVPKTTWSPIPWDAVDLGSSTPLEGRCDA